MSSYFVRVTLADLSSSLSLIGARLPPLIPSLLAASNGSGFYSSIVGKLAFLYNFRSSLGSY